MRKTFEPLRHGDTEKNKKKNSATLCLRGEWTFARGLVLEREGTNSANVLEVIRLLRALE